MTVLTGRWHRSSPCREVLDGVLVIRHSSGWEWLWKFKPGHVLKHYLWEFSLLLHLLVRGRHYQILHVHQALHAAFVTTFANLLLHRRVIVKIGCGGDLSDVKMMQQNRVSPFGRVFWRFIRRCDRMVAINREIADELLGDGFRPQQIVRIPNGFAVGNFPPRPSYELRDIAGGIGRSAGSQKGFDVLIDGFALTECPEAVRNIWRRQGVGGPAGQDLREGTGGAGDPDRDCQRRCRATPK